ncbi:hypothetical protein LOK49_LG13G01147 [Camellia lanceoleosa]|uniref:Uncharacterized protein n=1 Tax=Camellia lanceoleosa TaxID=1840588 RepID=A0ACC0FHL9_9ERIC|nr:hypothetical protein LOK49_LG13G01147 [Camellia lanceoleosa]
MESEKATNETLVSEEEYRNRHHWRETRWRSPTASPPLRFPTLGSLRVMLQADFKNVVTSTSVDHMRCFSDTAGRLQECALDAATKGNHYINSCLRLNEEMKGMDSLATKLKILRKNVDTLDSAVNRLLHLP